MMIKSKNTLVAQSAMLTGGVPNCNEEEEIIKEEKRRSFDGRNLTHKCHKHNNKYLMKRRGDGFLELEDQLDQCNKLRIL